MSTLPAMIASLASSRCREAGLDLGEGEIEVLLGEWMDLRQSLNQAIDTTLPFETSSKVFFSPSGKGSFIPCFAAPHQDSLPDQNSDLVTRPSPVVMDKREGESSLVFEKEDLRVVIHWNKLEHSSRVLTFARFSPSKEGEWLLQDHPSGSPAQTVVVKYSAAFWNPIVQDHNSILPCSAWSTLPDGFIVKASHYSHGLLWDPSGTSPAETCLYPDGSTYWRRRYRAGLCRDNASSPCFEAFWGTGTPMVVEYGHEGVGKHRPANQGPAYQEFHVNGQPALVMYAEHGKAKSCAWFNSDGTPLLQRETPALRNDLIPTNSLLSPDNHRLEFSVIPPALTALTVVSLGKKRILGRRRSA